MLRSKLGSSETVTSALSQWVPNNAKVNICYSSVYWDAYNPPDLGCEIHYWGPYNIEVYLILETIELNLYKIPSFFKASYKSLKIVIEWLSYQSSILFHSKSNIHNAGS